MFASKGLIIADSALPNESHELCIMALFDEVIEEADYATTEAIIATVVESEELN